MPNEFDQLIGKKIRELRTQNGLTQMELAAILRVSNTYLSKVENGERALQLDVLIRICDALGVNSDYILYDDSTARKRLVREIDRLPYEELNRIKEYTTARMEALQ